MRTFPLLMAAAVVLAGCKYEGSGVQKQYTADRNECRQYAEQTVGMQRGAPGGQMPTGREHLALVEQFARCMHKRGWAVNRPSQDGM